jgi:hypothetical protein
MFCPAANLLIPWPLLGLPHGEKIASRGGKNAKKRAAVAVARKLAVLLHRLWVTGETYEPLHDARRRGDVAA